MTQINEVPTLPHNTVFRVKAGDIIVADFRMKARQGTILAIGLVVLATAAPALAQMAERYASLFLTIDQNQDGIVTREEYAAFRDFAFEQLDLNKDGLISHEEYVSAARGSGDGPGRVVRFRVINKSATGSISGVEWAAQGEELFVLRDRDGNGALTSDEFDPRLMWRR